jgi:hypothetical protein
MWILALGLLCATGAMAQLVPPAGFDMIGFIQAATVTGGAANTNPLAGGTLTINGITMTVPKNSIVQMPAASFTWAQLFDPAFSAAVGTYVPARPNHPAGRTGFAQNDTIQTHFPSYEVRVVGNVVNGQYIVGLILPIAQQGLNAGEGLINFIDYATGRFRVGGTIGNPLSGTLCEINDPVGRFSLAHSPDPRFTCDTSNPTISAASGYPVGIPRVAPPAIDPLCPITNRPLNGTAGFPVDPFLAIGAPLRTFTMPAPGGAAGSPDPTKQVPLMVGDWVNFSGTLLKIDPLIGNTIANMFVSVHTLTAHLGIQTLPGVKPAYVRVEVMLFGVGPILPPPAPAEETSDRVVMVAFSTDPSATASIFAITVDPFNGVEIERPFPNGANIPMNDPVRGRIRLQLNKNLPDPPGNAVGTGLYHREYIVKLSTGQMPNVANGLIAGQYRLPIFDYIFPEGAVFGQPIPPYNFQDFGFLAVGSGPLGGPGSGGPIIGRLNPWPGL